MLLRPEEPRDREPVRELHLLAFGAGHGLVVADLVDDLRTSITPEVGGAWVAEDDGAVVGHVCSPRPCSTPRGGSSRSRS